jgi:predicted O-methyltransferase YrrM
VAFTRRRESGARRAAQAASAARGPERGAWLALAARHQLPQLAAHLGTLHGAAAACAGDGAGAADGGNGCTAALLVSLASPSHTELTRCAARGVARRVTRRAGQREKGGS